MSDQALDTGWKRLHPLSLAVNLVPRTWVLLRQIWPLMVGWVLLGRVSDQGLTDLFALVLFLSPAVVATIAHWALLRYRTVDEHLVVETGLLNRQTRTIAVDRVQNVELVRNVFHRLFGLVEVRIETASGKEVEGLLSALRQDEAERLLGFLERGRASRQAATEGAAAPPEARVLVRTAPLDLLWYGATGTRLASVAVLLGFVYELALAPGTNPDDLRGVPSLGAEVAPVLLLAVATGAWWLGLLGALGRFWGYRLALEGDALVSEQGLFTRRSARLALGKIQRLELVEPLARRALGFGSLTIETASARQEGDGLERAETVVPCVEPALAGPLVAAALPSLGDLALDTERLALRPAHPFALTRAVARTLLASLGGVAVAVAVAGPVGALALVVVPVLVGASWLDVRSQGFASAPGVVLSRRGWWVRRTVVVPLSKVQSVELDQGPWLRRRALAELTVRVAGGRVRLPLQELREATRTRGEILSLAR